MKVLSILLGVCFVFSVSTKVFAGEGTHKAEKPASAKVVDAKTTAKDAKKAEETKTCGCTEGAKECACSKDSKPCNCHRKKNEKAHNHKDGKPCNCANKEKMAS